ncbi:MAG: hypothetical protein GX097_08300 [Methanomicrobiales archaeon]|nr:hypothetical protein [Methanomicrobiales archaeon]
MYQANIGASLRGKKNTPCGVRVTRRVYGHPEEGSGRTPPPSMSTE